MKAKYQPRHNSQGSRNFFRWASAETIIWTDERANIMMKEKPYDGVFLGALNQAYVRPKNQSHKKERQTTL